jgi:hypothetical protein
MIVPAFYGPDERPRGTSDRVINLGVMRAFNGCKILLLRCPHRPGFSKEVAMGIDTVITAGDRHQSPYFAWRTDDKPSTPNPATGTFEDALRLALARAS